MLNLAELEGFEWHEGNLQKSQRMKNISGKEERWLAFGRTDEGKLLGCAFTIRGKLIRVSSVRPMSRRERKWYEQKHPIR